MAERSGETAEPVKEEPATELAGGSGGIGQQQAVPMSTDADELEPECTSEPGQIRLSLSKCILCASLFLPDQCPKLLECLHAACSTCVEAKITALEQQPASAVDAETAPDIGILCEVCNVLSQPDNLIDNRLVAKFFEDDASTVCDEEPKDEEEKKCTNCSENAVATSWCVECEEYICQNCVMAHQRLKITKDHTIKPKEEVTNEAESSKKKEKKQPGHLYCTLHQHEQLSLFCQTCDRLTCRDCQLSEHRDHKYKFIHEIAAETRTSVKTLLNEVSYKRELLKSAMKVIEDRQVLISEKKKNLVQEITVMVYELTKAVNTRGKQLITRLSEVCDQKQNTLNEKKIALDQLSKLTDHCINFVNYALDKGDDMELLYSKRSVTNHLQRIKSRRADIPNPEIPVRIHLSMEKMQDLVKVISSIGGIVVDGRTYPSITPPLESSAPSTPLSDPGELKQLNPCPVSLAMDTSPVLPGISLLPNQPSNNMIPNAFMNQPLNIPISTHQQMMQSQQMANQQQMSANYMQHYNTHNMQQRSSPQGQRLPAYNLNYNGRMQQQPMMMPQRPGLGNCHQQVTSSTHPHQQQIHVTVPDPHLNQNASLRGLLAHNPPAYRPPTTNTAQYPRFQPRYPYPMNNPQQRAIAPPQAYPAGTSILNTNMQQMQRQPNQVSQQSIMSMYQQQPQTMQSARWHIPQNLNNATAGTSYPARSNAPQQNSSSGPVNDTYKITLKNQPALSVAPQLKNNNNTVSPPVNSNGSGSAPTPVSTVSHTVSSTMPKTPSPALNEKNDETQSLDKFAQKSFNDLMLTIAKLDSNGIVVIPEAQKNQLDSAQVDSSTDEGANAMTDNSSVASMTKDDPNEDWCAVCMDGGDAVLCCDKCPKVFHLYCHIPSLKSFPHESETWQCMLCTNVHDCSDDEPGEKRTNGMTARDLRVAQRIVLELYCQYEQSLPFREIVSREIVEYHEVIKNPIALDIIKNKLNPDNEKHYSELKQVMADIRLMFKNAYTFNPVDSQVYQEARSLEEFFEKLLTKWAPNYAYDDSFHSGEGEEDEQVFPPNRKYRRIIIPD